MAFSWFGGGGGKTSQTEILCKKIDIVTDGNMEEIQWDIIMDITDGLNGDTNRAKRVLGHLKRILEKSISISSDNQSLKNCLIVIDSLSRNGNDNILSVIHSSYLNTLSKLAISVDTDSAKLKSLLQSSENNKTCRDMVLELILDWQLNDNSNGSYNIDQNKYPNFHKIFVELKQNGAPFNKIIVERERLKKQKEIDERNRKFKEEHVNEDNQEEDNNNNNIVYEDEEKENNPWSDKNMHFGRWYKSKLKADLSKLIDMICMTQDIISMKNVNDAQLMCMELREANKRLQTIMLRTDDPPAIDSLLQLITINSALLDCYKKLINNQKFVMPGVTRQHLSMLIKPL